uniref:Uncharacterized protein n=1 Tax=Lygus hesperus TaxID=30085 RepID=A0A0A9WHT9_LYGHE
MRTHSQMNPAVTAFVGLALLAGSYGLPIGNGFAGISLAPGALGDFYNQEVVVGDFPLKYGLSWSKDGTIEAGIRLETTFRGKVVPFSIAVSGNARDLRRTFKFEAGTRILDSLSGLIYGDRDGLKWLTSLWVPVHSQRGTLNAVGVSLEGDHTRPVAVSGGFGINDSVYQARIKLDGDLKPSGTQVLIGTKSSKSTNVFPSPYNNIPFSRFSHQ